MKQSPEGGVWQDPGQAGNECQGRDGEGKGFSEDLGVTALLGQGFF